MLFIFRFSIFHDFGISPRSPLGLQGLVTLDMCTDGRTP